MSHTRNAQNEDAEILSRFDTLDVDTEQVETMREVREAFREFIADTVLELAPGSRERSLALTALEEAKYWVNQSIARHGVRTD